MSNNPDWRRLAIKRAATIERLEKSLCRQAQRAELAEADAGRLRTTIEHRDAELRQLKAGFGTLDAAETDPS